MWIGFLLLLLLPELFRLAKLISHFLSAVLCEGKTCRLSTLGGTLFTVHCILCTEHCTLFTVHCILCAEHCTLFTVHCILYTIHCNLYTVYCKLYIVHCTVSSVNCTHYTVNYRFQALRYQGCYRTELLPSLMAQGLETSPPNTGVEGSNPSGLKCDNQKSTLRHGWYPL